MNRVRVLLASLALSLAVAQAASAQSAPPVNYYDAAIGKTGTALKDALHDIIKGHTQIPYTASTTDTWDALCFLDEDPANNTRVVLEYSGFTIAKSAQVGTSGGTWNREHLWPQSFGLDDINEFSIAKTDLFNLRPADEVVNNLRGNKFYDTSTAPISTNAGAPGCTYDADSWEPRAVEKGDIARSMFYMDVRYDGSDAEVPDLILSDSPNATQNRFGKLTTLLAWHRQTPVTAAERARNHRIYTTYQFNRNPFVDRPEWADIIFAGAAPAQAWKNLRFTTAELSSSAISGDTSDPDFDGLRNLVEYAFHRNPRTADTAPLVTASRNPDGALQVVFTRDRFASDVAITYETLANPGTTWVPVVAQTVSATAITFETEQVTARIPGPATGFAVRLRATRP